MVSVFNAADNRPLRVPSSGKNINRFRFSHPRGLEMEVSCVVAEQVIRPTGVLDPVVEVRPTMGQVDDCGEIRAGGQEPAGSRHHPY